jgi:hypothetical protein
MKDVLERYIRSLAERELEKDAPETLQDLGTFVHWLIERLGYDVYLRAFKHEGTSQVKSAGRLQLGVDMVATRFDPDGSRRLCRLVLKEGPVTKGVWGRSAEEGNIIHDIRLAADRHRRREYEDVVFGGEEPAHVSVIAVHNGDFDAESLGELRQQLAAELSTRGITLEWWDAGELSRLAHKVATRGLGDDAGIDACLFPPGVRPFARMALDSLRRPGRRFDLDAVDTFIEAKLPLGREEVREGAVERLAAGTPLKALTLRRRVAELAVFAAMIRAESAASASDLTLPTFDACERIVCRIAEHAQRVGVERMGDHQKAIRASLVDVANVYMRAGDLLRDRLATLADVPYVTAPPTAFFSGNEAMRRLGAWRGEPGSRLRTSPE